MGDEKHEAEGAIEELKIQRISTLTFCGAYKPHRLGEARRGGLGCACHIHCML